MLKSPAWPSRGSERGRRGLSPGWPLWHGHFHAPFPLEQMGKCSRFGPIDPSSLAWSQLSLPGDTDHTVPCHQLQGRPPQARPQFQKWLCNILEGRDEGLG